MGTSAALLDIATDHARKRIRGTVSDHVLLHQLGCRVVGLPEQLLPERRPLGNASSTQQLLAVLAIAVGRSDIVHADEAEADSDSDEAGSHLSSPPSSQRERGTASSSKLAVLHSSTDLPPDLLSRARS